MPEDMNGNDGISPHTSTSGVGAAKDDSNARSRFESYLVEFRVSSAFDADSKVFLADIPGVNVDGSFKPIIMSPLEGPLAAGEKTVVVRADIDVMNRDQVAAHPDVIRMWKDSPIAPFRPRLKNDIVSLPDGVDTYSEATGRITGEKRVAAFGQDEDCSRSVAKGTIRDVAKFLGVDSIWQRGVYGKNVVVGIVDGGIRASGREIGSAENGRDVLDDVVGGWPEGPGGWGTRADRWDDHGMMCAWAVKGMAPLALLYDLRISDGSAVSSALQAYDWAINQFRKNGTPHILTNSWGIWQKSWDVSYASDIDHPFTRKVVEAIDLGIVVLFAAGNCGDACPDGSCGEDVGPGRSIWGANGHERVITVGAVNVRGQYVGYSSQGPAALWDGKPDVCSVTHYAGYFDVDTGTSAATPIAAGVVALLKSARPKLKQDETRKLLVMNARLISGDNAGGRSGAGVIRAKETFDKLDRSVRSPTWVSLGGTFSEGVSAVATSPGRLDLFGVGSTDQLLHAWFTDGRWFGWEDLGGELLSAPSAVSRRPGRIEIFGVGSDQTMWHGAWDGKDLTPWVSLGGTFSEGVSAVATSPGRLDLFGVGSTDQLLHAWFTDGRWFGWEDLGGELLSAPSAVSRRPGRIEIFGVGSDQTMWHGAWDGKDLTPWVSLGGTFSEGVSAVATSPGRLDLFGVGSTDQLLHAWFTDGRWFGWEDLGGELLSAPSAVSRRPGQIEIFGVGSDQTMWQLPFESNEP